ncbi:MAG: T9SS type A sorting domain-containing protein [Bacteroidota bacterium]
MRSIAVSRTCIRGAVLLLAGLAASLPAEAQRLAGSVLAGAGGASENASFRLTSTLGEPAIGTMLGPAFRHRAGFLGGVGSVLVATSEEEGPDAPSVLVLHPPAPNPSRGAARVWVDLPTPAPVRLVVYDALGREVAVALDEERPAGRHTVELASVGLASGTYVIRLTAGDEVRTQRLTVVR